MTEINERKKSLLHHHHQFDFSKEMEKFTFRLHNRNETIRFKTSIRLKCLAEINRHRSPSCSPIDPQSFLYDVYFERYTSL